MILTIALIAVTAIVSYKGFQDSSFLQQYSFSIHRVREYREYYRYVTSGFLHVSWIHLAINMFVLFAFGSGLEQAFGMVPFLIVYLGSLVGGNALALLIHKHSYRYTSVGASGAVSGLIFGSIALDPRLSIFFIPGWIFGALYVLYTIYAIRSQKTDVGHAAHLGGALIGMLISILLHPAAIVHNWLAILTIFVPGAALVLVMIYRPDLILVDKKNQRKHLSYEDRYNLDKLDRKKQVDKILEKISEKGISSLTGKEKKILEEYSRSGN